MAQRLHAYLRSLEWDDRMPPLVDLDLFFEGNDEEESIAPNQWEEGRPPIASLYARFKAIAARPDVAQVLVGLHWEWNDADYADGYPPAATVFIITSAKGAEVETWVEGMCGDGVLRGWPHGKPRNAPDIEDGHRVYWVSWD